MQASAFSNVTPPNARTGIFSSQASRSAFDTGRAGGRFLLFKDWSEDRKVRAFLRGAGDFGSNVAGDADCHPGWGSSTLSPNLFYFRWGNVIRAQVHSLSAAS